MDLRPRRGPTPEAHRLESADEEHGLDSSRGLEESDRRLDCRLKNQAPADVCAEEQAMVKTRL